MAVKILMSIDGEFCGPASRGTVRHIQVIRETLGLSLAEAKQIVDRCVFDEETVEIEVESEALAAELTRRLGELEEPPRTRLRTVP